MKEKQITIPNSDLKSSVVYPLYLSSKEIIRRYNELLKEYDITYTQYLVMMYFFHEKTSNLKSIGKVLMLDSSTLTPLLKKLEKKGFITREKSSTDERNLIVTITEEGSALKPKLQKVRKEIKRICNLTEEEVEMIHKITNKLVINMMEESKNANNKRK